MHACSKSPGSTAPASTSAAPAKTPLNLTGTVVIGASVSDGFDTTDPAVPDGPPDTTSMTLGKFGGGTKRITLVHLLTALADPASAAPKGFTSSVFFMNPRGVAETQIKSAVALKPTIVFALDYLFWHAYGDLPDAKRPALLEQGFKRLETLPPTCTIIVADLPDMSHSIGKMLFAAQVPSKDTLAALNDRLSQWAGSHPNVILIPLKDTVKAAMSTPPGSTTLGGQTFSGPDARALLGPDGLHATFSGLLAFTNEALMQLQARGTLPKTADWPRKHADIIARLGAQRTQAPPTSSTP